MSFNTYQRKLIIALTLLFCITGCEKKQLPTLNSNATVVAFGDSLTYGIGANKDFSYPQILAELTGLNIINAGISGETTSEGVKRFATVLEKYNPELVILLEGGNDILRNHPAATTRKNLAQMIEMAQAQQIPVILIGVPEKKLFSSSAPFYAELAEEYQLVFDGEIISSLLKNSKYKSDPIHFNAQGYRQFALRIMNLLEENGGLTQS